MKNYLRGIITGILLIFASLITLILTILTGPKNSKDFFVGFMKGTEFHKNDEPFL